VYLHAGDTVLAWTRIENDSTVARLTYAVCVVAAWGSDAVLRRVAARRRAAARRRHTASSPAALACVADIHAARSRLVDAVDAIDQARKADEPVADDTLRVLRAEVGGIAEEAELFVAKLRRLEDRCRARQRTEQDPTTHGSRSRHRRDRRRAERRAHRSAPARPRVDRTAGSGSR
jgi:hypothetical protein